ncbi:MAG: hypothetical protein WBR26_22875 [Candidatus Acidiferrum sp.]
MSKVYDKLAAEFPDAIGEPAPRITEEHAPSATPTNGKANGHVTTATHKKPASKFKSVSAETAKKAKKGTTSSSRTGKSRQATVEFGKPPKHIWVRVDTRPNYRQMNVPVYIDKDRDQTYYVSPEFYESDAIPERFKRACVLIDIYTAGLADGSFLLWTVGVSASKWRKGAVAAVMAAMEGYVLVEAFKPRSTYLITTCEEDIPAPKFETLGSFESLLEQAFDGVITAAHDEAVARYLSGGYWEELDEQQDGD